MTAYSVRDVSAALGLPSRTIYSLVRSGLVVPARGPRRQLRFSFQDILALKTAHGLMAAATSRRRITRAIAALRRQLPPELPLAGLRIRAIGDRVVVQEKTRTWDAESGQGVLSFEVTAKNARLHVIALDVPREAANEPRDEPSRNTPEPAQIDQWFADALSLEESAPPAARKRYEQIIAADATHASAYINCGRLLHEAHEWNEAERLYRMAIELCGGSTLLLFNLGVLLEDENRTEEAIAAYQQALQFDPDHGDSHYNLARIFEAAGRAHHAIRHFNRYRALTRKSGPSTRPRLPPKD